MHVPMRAAPRTQHTCHSGGRLGAVLNSPWSCSHDSMPSPRASYSANCSARNLRAVPLSSHTCRHADAADAARRPLVGRHSQCVYMYT